VDGILKRRLPGNQRDDPSEQSATTTCRGFFGGLVIFCLLAVAPFRLSWAFQSQKTRVLPPASHLPPSDQPADRAANSNDDLGRLEDIESYIKQGKYQEAISLLEVYLKEYPNSSRGYYDLGYTTFRTHDLETSIKSLSKSLSLNPTNPEAHKILGLDCQFVGRYDLAETELREAIREKPDSAEIHYFLGRLYHTRGVYPLAKGELEEAIRLNPSFMKAYDNLGLTMEILGDNNAALKAYTIAMKLDEDQRLLSEWPYVNVSAFYNRQEKPDLALAYARKAAELNPKSDSAYFQMAKAYQSNGEWRECADAAQKAIDLNPKTRDYFYVLGIALRKLGKTKESRAAMDKFGQMHKDELVDLPHKLASPNSRGMAANPGQLDHD
jgi:tetratricopeptide (TPR) repeat protein